MKEYDINEVIRLRDQEKLQWKQIEEIIGVSNETLRKAYKRTKEGITSHQANPNSAKLQKIRGITRKFKAIMDRGGKCECCGYNKNMAALDFHHINPEEKSFGLDMKAFSNHSWEVISLELNKCKLLCANCHREIHNPLLDFSKLNDYIDQTRLESLGKEKVIPTCSICGAPVTKEGNLCVKCQHEKQRKVNRPSREELKDLIRNKSFVSIGQMFGVTNKSIEKWCISYNLPSKKLKIKEISDEDWLKI